MSAQQFDTPSPMRIDRRIYLLLPLVVAVVFLLSACSGKTGTSADSASSTAVAPSPSGPVSFSIDIQPILQERCVNCHGGQRTEKGLDMTSYASLMAGSQNGAVVEPGNPDNSPMIQLVQQGKMPKRGPKLLPNQVQMLVDWIKAGAPNN